MKYIFLPLFSMIVSMSFMAQAADQVCQYSGQHKNEIIFLTIHLDEQTVNTLEFRSSIHGISYLSTVNEVSDLGPVKRYSGELSTPWAEGTSFEIYIRNNHSGIFRIQRIPNHPVHIPLTCN